MLNLLTRLFFLILCTCGPALCGAQKKLPISSSTRHVTVYRAGAQVQRSGEVDLPTGRTTLIVGGLSSGLNPASIQASTQTGGVLILSVSHRLRFPELVEDSPEREDIYTRIERLEDRRRRLLTEVEIAQEEEALLHENRKLASSERGLSAADLQEGVRFYRERIAVIKRSYLALGDSLRDNDERRELLQRQLAKLGETERAPATSEVVVLVEAERAVRAAFDLRYLVADAGWTPEYDVRVESVDQPIDLRYHARVQQSSGEDWTDVRLSLSTGDPRESAEVPELQVWRLRDGQLPPVYPTEIPGNSTVAIREVSGTVTDREGIGMIGATVMVTGTDIGTVTDIDGRYTLEVPEAGSTLTVNYPGYDPAVAPISSATVHIVLQESITQLEEVVAYEQLRGRVAGLDIEGKRQKAAGAELAPPPVPTQTQRRATTLTFAIELPYTIPSDGKDRRVEIKQYAIPAEYRHLTVPKRTEEVYLSAVIRDWEQYDLVSGDLQLFFEGTYLGTSVLDVTKTADSLSLSLGRDASVIVSRERNEDYQRNTGLFNSKRTDSRGWIIAVRNTKRQPIRLTLVDQVPVSAQGSIDVDTDLPDDAQFDGETGEVTWQFDLAPDTERKVSFGYSVRYGAYERVYLE
ncbi:mucoidy inhibitor MuiA family protein [Neolewinella sp.]|uniref:DUF4139 domain-containing protein n=1 Tax=Neolewinella sp. TaxID=2993543 RepID=UPI003B5158D9